MQNRFLASLIFAIVLTVGAFAQSTEFTYQGNLKDGVNAANGNYDFEFALFDAVSAGTQLGSTVTRNSVAVAGGTFAVSLDFGNQFPGVNRFLEIRVRAVGGGTFTTLSPRQSVSSSPYSVKSLTADNATNAVNATNATTAVNATNAANATNAVTANNALNLGGVAAAQYVLTGDPRMSDARNPLPGSGNYIQNTTTPQAGNFNIVGSGTAGGTLNGGVINALTEYRMSGSRILGNTGTNNLFVGVGAGDVNTTGQSNTFVGRFAGNANTTGNSNSFFGTLAGRDNTGPNNSFFGANAGLQNTSGQANAFFGQSTGSANTTGLGNSFLGRLSGISNTIGNFNTAVGFTADFLASNLTNATAIGAQSAVGQSNSLVLGSINGVNGATANTNVGIGTTTPSERLHVVGNGLFTGNVNISGSLTATLPTGSANYIQNTTTQQAASNFSISGDGAAGGTLSGNVISSATQYNIGANRILSNAGTDNLFAGANAAAANPTGIMNSFFGAFSGQANTTANNNSFFGSSAGRSNTTGQGNSFFGSVAGLSSTTGSGNTFFGRASGAQNSTGGGNSFFGDSAGDTNTNGNNNTAIGSGADIIAAATNATAIGFRAAVGQSNSLVLGSINGINGSIADTNVGIGTTAPSERLHVVGNGLFSGNLTAGAQYNIGGARILSNPGTDNLFAGVGAGLANTIGVSNSFFGPGAGQSNTDGSRNSFFGTSAGQANTGGDGNSFFGMKAGFANTTGFSNVFIGETAGTGNTSGTGNTFVGVSSGSSNTTGLNNVIVGQNAGMNNTTGNENAIFGWFAGSGNTTGDLISLFGRSANVLADNLTNASAFGARAAVGASNSLVLGSIAGVNAATVSTNVGIGTTTPSATLDVVGMIEVSTLGAAGATTLCRNASNQISTCSSSLRYKSNIAGFSSGLAFIRQLRPISFDWKDSGMKDVGFGAEDVAKIDPRFVTYNDKGEVEGVKYDRLSVAFVNAFKEQQAQIEEQDRRIGEQQNEIAERKATEQRLQSQIDNLKKIVCSLMPDADGCKQEEK